MTRCTRCGDPDAHMFAIEERGWKPYVMTYCQECADRKFEEEKVLRMVKLKGASDD